LLSSLAFTSGPISLLATNEVYVFLLVVRTLPLNILTLLAQTRS